MVAYDTTTMTWILGAIFAIAAIGLGLLAAGIVVVVRDNRAARLSRGQSMRTYYGNLALHH